MPRERKKRQQSSIDLLPDAVRRLLQEMLADRKLTQKEAVQRINEALSIMRAEGKLPPESPAQLSKSAVNRYALEMEEVGRDLRESREIAEMWIGKLGAVPEGQVGNLVNQILRTMSFDLSIMLKRGGIDPDNAPAVVAMLKDLALTTQRLEQASTLNVKREAEIRRQALQDAANAIGDEARAQGMDEEQARFWREKVLGVK